MKIWDLPTRLYHWGQAVLVVAMLITGKLDEGPHFELGLLLISLILWRIVWGFIGSETSRFSQFIVSPRKTLQYFQGKKQEYVGHNPAGGWMVVALIGFLLVQCVTGMIIGGLFDEAPLTATLISDEVFDHAVELHILISNLLPYLIAAHLLAIIMYKIKGIPLVKAMLTGKNRTFSGRSVELASNFKALIVLVLVAPFSIYFFFLL